MGDVRACVQTEERICRICLEDSTLGKLFSPCNCSGSMKYVHIACLEKWRTVYSTNPESFFFCENCRREYLLHRSTLAKLLSSEVMVTSLTAASMGVIILGSGTGMIALNREKWNLNNATFYGVVVTGISGLVPKLPIIAREILSFHWMKTFQKDKDASAISAGFAIIAFGAVNAVSSLYSNVHSLCNRLTKVVGEKVLDISQDISRSEEDEIIFHSEVLVTE